MITGAPKPEKPPAPYATGARILRWLDVILRPLAVGLVTWYVLRLPLPLLQEWLPFQNFLAAVVAIVLSGKCLYDTLFYERFWP